MPLSDSAPGAGVIPPLLAELVDELREADREDRIEILLDHARSLPPLPEELERHKDANHRVEECQSPVYLFVSVHDDRIRMHADVPMEAPTVRGFVSLLIEGLQNASPDAVLQLPSDLVQRAGLLEILGLLRVRGLTGVLQRVKRETLAARNASQNPA